MLEGSKEFQKVSLCLIDHSKAIDYVNHEQLCVALKEMGRPQHLIVLPCNLHCGQEATVRIEYRETELFPTGKGVRQRCTLSSHLFNLYTEHII